MDVTFTHCAGLDVHKKTVVACCLTPDPAGGHRRETRTFGTMLADLLALTDWLTSQQVTHVAMESTGEFWKPLYNLLEGNVTVWVVNAQHIKNVPGRKTDVNDAAWIADLLAHGLLRPSFIPPQPQRDLRDLTRERTNLVQDRATVVRRLHKVLEWANLKLTSVLTDVTGVSGRAILAALLAGEEDPTVLANLAKGRLRSQRAEWEQALAGRVREHHRFVLTQHLLHVDTLEEQIAAYDAQIAATIAAHSQPQPVPASAPATPPTNPLPLTWAAALPLLDTVPGVGQAVGEHLLAEIGTDRGRFADAHHLSSWAKLSPGNNESAGKRYSGRTGHGNRWLRSILVQAAHAAVKNPQGYFGRVYRRLVVRLGVKKAIIAIAHRILIAVYHVLRKQEPYREPQVREGTERHQQQVVRRLQRRLEQCGYQVSLTPLPAAAS